MTVPATTRRAGPFTGNGVTSTFPFAFKVFTSADLAVVRATSGVENALALGTDYTVSLNVDQDASPGGTVNLTAPLATGDTLAIVGDIDYDQQLDLPGGGAFRPLALENALDRTVIQIQQLREEVERTLRVPVTSDANIELPAPEAVKLIGWDSSATGLQNYDALDLVTAQLYADWTFDTFTGNGTATAFALQRSPGSLGNIDVSIDGVTQVPGVDYAVSGSTLAFTSPPPNGTEILARYGSSAVQGVLGFTTEYKTATAGQTVFTLTNPYTPGGSNLKVYVNGLAARGGVDYLETNTTTVTFTSGLSLNDDVRFEVGGTTNAAAAASQVGYVPAGTGAVATSVESALRRRIHVEDFGAVGDAMVDDTAAFQRAIDYAESLVGTNALDAVGVQIDLAGKKYRIAGTIYIRRGGIALVGPAGRGAMLDGDGTVDMVSVGDLTNAARVRFAEFENIHFYCASTTSTATGLVLYRTIQCQIEKCKFTNWNVHIRGRRSSTTHLDRCYFTNSNRTTQASALILLEGLDESTFPTPETYSPGGGWHITDCEFAGRGANGAVDTTYGIWAKSVDGLYVTQCHLTDCWYSLALEPEGSAANRTIIDVHVVNCYFDNASSLASAPRNVVIGGTVRESITLASGATTRSVYQSISFVGGHMRGCFEVDRCCVVQVTDGDNWWNSSVRLLQNIVFNGVHFGQARSTALQLFGASNTPTDTYVEAFGVVVSGCVFYKNGTDNPSNVSTAIHAHCGQIVISNNVFLPNDGTSDFLVLVAPTDFGDDQGAGSVVIEGNDFSKADGYAIAPSRVLASATGSAVAQYGNVYPGPGFHIDELYKVTTTDTTPTVIFSYVIPQGAAGTIDVELQGSNSDGSKAVAYTWTGGFRRNAGGTTLSSGGSSLTAGLAWNPDAFGTAPTAALSSNTLTVTVTGLAATTIDWSARVRLSRSR